MSGRTPRTQQPALLHDAITRSLPVMASAKRKTSVFIGRQIRVDRDEVDRIRSSIEPATDALLGMPRESSDVEGGHYDTDDEMGDDDSSEPIGVKRDPSRASLLSSSDGKESQPSQPATPPRKRQRTGAREPRGQTLRRRSKRLRTAAVQTASRLRPKPSPKPKSQPQPKPQPQLREKRAVREHHPVASTAGKEWEIESIVGSYIEADTLKHFYLVKWKGFAPKHNTWEPKRNLARCSAVIATYEKGAGKTGRKKAC